MSHSIILCLALGAVPLCLACNNAGASTDKADAAPSDFEKAREDYRHQKQTDLDLLDKSITDLEARERASTVKAKADLQSILPSLKSQRDAFVSDLHGIDSAIASMWDSTKARLDKEWADLKMATDKAASMTVLSAATTHKPGEMTCDEFVALADVEKPKIVYWAEGFNRSGKSIDSVVDVDETDRLVPVLVAECTRNPQESLSKLVRQHASAARKPVSAAPAPAKMTCEQFVALEDVVKPKLVYWAEGFNINKDGGATDAVVAIDETDRLVPVLVTECKEAPKLTLWQKIKNYL